MVSEAEVEVAAEAAAEAAGGAAAGFVTSEQVEGSEEAELRSRIASDASDMEAHVLLSKVYAHACVHARSCACRCLRAHAHAREHARCSHTLSHTQCR